MKLDIEQLRAVTCGAARVKDADEGVSFYRFTEEQEELYKNRSGDFYIKTFATSGVKLMFKTDSRSLFMDVMVSKGSSRKYFSFDVFADGKPVGYLDNFSTVALPDNYTTEELPLGEVEKRFDLGEGEKTVTVYLPWGTAVCFKELSLDDGASVVPVTRKKKLLAFGDSITHGYDALRPSNKYITKLCDALDCEEFNKGIGGEVFCPALAATRENFEPDYITVAYGTNYWSKCERETFLKNCEGFYHNLSQTYPRSKIFAITPIWRKNQEDSKPCGAFSDVETTIRAVAASLDNVTVISGFDFVPKDSVYFADKTLHPNDAGFDHYFKNLYEQIKMHI